MAGTNVGMACITKKEVICFTDLNDLTHQRVRAIAEDKNGNLWFGTFEGLTYYNGREFVKMTRDNGLNQNRIRGITTDRNGDIWLATHFGGISRYSSDPFTRFGRKEGLPDDNILAIHGNGKTCWQ